MGRPIAVLLAGYVLWFSGEADMVRAETIAIELSNPVVEITSSFSGASVTVFGVIERDRATVSRVGKYEVVLTVAGPQQRVLVQRRERIAGVWVNTAGQTFTELPSFYAVYSTSLVEDIALATTARALRLGLEYVGHGGVLRGTSGSREPYRSALVELKQEEGLYIERAGSIRMFRPDVFTASIALPASVQDGVYQVSAHLFAGGTYLAADTAELRVAKTGLEQTVFEWSTSYALMYGLGVVVMALGTGYLGGVLFRRG